MKVLVTGGGGFIGSHLTERLLAGGNEVVVLDNFDTFYDPAVKHANLEEARDHDGFTEIRGDIRDPASYARMPDDIDSVIHLAARAGVRPSIEDPRLYVDVNIQGTGLVLDFLALRGIPRFLFGSSSSVYGESAPVPFSENDAADRPISPYAATKRAGELLVHAHSHLVGTSALCLRFFTVYGPRQRPDLAIHKFARMMKAGEAIPMFGDGTTERDYTYIDDILNGVEGALDYLTRHPGTCDIVNLGGARTISLRSMIDHVGTAMGVEPRIMRMPDQPGDVTRTFADVSKAQRLFGYGPSTPFAVGLGHFADWYLAQNAPAQNGRGHGVANLRERVVASGR